MDILGLIVIVVGIALIFSGRITTRSLPPNYDASSDDGFFELLKSVGKVLAGAGIVFVIGGVILILV